jgi:hypothetical protein
MKQRLKTLILGSALAVLMFSGTAVAYQAPAAKDSKGTKSASSTTTAPSDKDIADAKAKGLVWVNTSTKVYHKDGEFYGKTKRGQFMTEADAQKAGNREAKPSGVSKKKATDSKK